MKYKSGESNLPDTLDFPVSYEDIMRRVGSVDPARYSSSRNYIGGAVTHLSPYIARGVLSGREVVASLKLHGYSNWELQAIIQQLAWREYFQRVWQQLGDAVFNDIKRPQPGVVHDELPLSIPAASTGIKVIDEQLDLLFSTGYMHNHVRMYTASLACNVGKSNWRLPAKWMYYHLLDGDLASNTCSWQWVSGAFASKQYYFNQDNLNKYSGSTQHGTFIDVSYEALPLLEIPSELSAKTVPSLNTKLPETGPPLIDPSKPTLIYNSYNLDPSWRADHDVNRILLLEPSHFDRFPVSEKVVNFVISLAENIQGIHLVVGEIDQITRSYNMAGRPVDIISKEHPAFRHYPGQKDPRDWMFPDVTNFYPSFSQYWKNCSLTRL